MLSSDSTPELARDFSTRLRLTHPLEPTYVNPLARDQKNLPEKLLLQHMMFCWDQMLCEHFGFGLARELSLWFFGFYSILRSHFLSDHPICIARFLIHSIAAFLKLHGFLRSICTERFYPRLATIVSWHPCFGIWLAFQTRIGQR